MWYPVMVGILSQVSDYYALLREFNVPTPEEDIATVSFMDADYSAPQGCRPGQQKLQKITQAQVHQMLCCLLDSHACPSCLACHDQQVEVFFKQHT